MELILVVVISAGMAENSQNGVSRSLRPRKHQHWRVPRQLACFHLATKILSMAVHSNEL